MDFSLENSRGVDLPIVSGVRRHKGPGDSGHRERDVQTRGRLTGIEPSAGFSHGIHTDKQPTVERSGDGFGRRLKRDGVAYPRPGERLHQVKLAGVVGVVHIVVAEERPSILHHAEPEDCRSVPKIDRTLPNTCERVDRWLR
jgi:hypothetical protein